MIRLARYLPLNIRGNTQRFSFALSIVVFAAMAFCFVSCDRKKPSVSSPPRVVVGWQTAWATCGQVIETLVHTNITKLHGTNATFRDFLFGPDMLEAALGGNLDATSVGIVPAINLLAANDGWVIVCRLIDFQCSTIARKGTGITSYADLKGKKLGVPFGSGAHPYVVQRLKENKLSIGRGISSVELLNISPAEGAVVLQQKGVDALGIWEPNATIIEGKGLGKSIDDKRYIGVMVVRKSIVENNPDEIVALIKSLIEANFYVTKHRDQTDEWFAKRSNFDRTLLKKIRIIEPNLTAKNIEDISIQLTSEDISQCQQVADQMFESALIKHPVKIAEHTNLKLAAQAAEEISKDGGKSNSIQIMEMK
jgi:sulfonate transport system substrate-binding protein